MMKITKEYKVKRMKGLLRINDANATIRRSSTELFLIFKNIHSGRCKLLKLNSFEFFRSKINESSNHSVCRNWQLKLYLLPVALSIVGEHCIN